MEVRNKTFAVGQIFRGVVNGETLKVTRVQGGKGLYYKQTGTYITFQNERGQSGTVNLKTAQRLLLDPISTHDGSSQKVLPA